MANVGNSLANVGKQQVTERSIAHSSANKGLFTLGKIFSK